MKSLEEQVKILERILKRFEFNVPIQQEDNTHFPEFLRNRLDKYIDFIENIVLKEISEKVIFDKTDILLPKIKSLSNSLNKVIELYYNGKVLESTKEFNKALSNTLFDEIKISSKINEICLYRARRENGTRFTKKDLFHIKFEERHLVASNRYSIPGFPALYLGSNTYVCWEEFNRYNLRDLQFSRFGAKDLNVIKFERAEDLLTNLSDNPSLKLTDLLRYITIFPLMIASSIKTKHPKGNFKAEYIVPQLLLQYVSKNREIDGIKFISTRVDYSKIKDVDAYNYVFPVKTSRKKGFCSRLVNLFKVTEPTSLMLEEIMHNTKHLISTSEHLKESGYMQFNSKYAINYSTTAFGRIEEALDKIDLTKIDNS